MIAGGSGLKGEGEGDKHTRWMAQSPKAMHDKPHFPHLMLQRGQKAAKKRVPIYFCYTCSRNDALPSSVTQNREKPVPGACTNEPG